MSKPKLTLWYPGEVKPVYVGLYERKYDDRSIHFCYWTGEYFSVLLEPNEQEDDEYIFMLSPFQDEPWRGLTEPSK